MKAIWGFCCVTVLVGVTGCGDGGPALSSVTGTVLLDGEPVEGAIVMFVPQADSSVQRPAYGYTDPEGYFLMNFKEGTDGVPTGSSQVRIYTNDNATWKGKKYSGRELFPPEYVRGFEIVKIGEGANEFKFECTTDGFKAKKQQLDF